MSLEKVTKITGRGVYVPGDDIDTDRIIPARFMKCVTFDGLGQYLFYDVRHHEDGRKKDHPLNDARFEGATVLISGRNFGCGSSREHAPQAIRKHGFRAVIAANFAEIFFGNATTLGMPCVSLDIAHIEKLGRMIGNDPGVGITIDLEAGEVHAGAEKFPLQIKPGARESLVRGEWDPIGFLLEGTEETAKTAAKLPYVNRFA
ncbi:MAG: 3-isopropylmalate dehydratase small subunit [Deltaproteobacteria bacterium]|nr:3-isopropylmalate dehydratase small subunit [Deltaproteobacteria bacterium]